MFKEYIVELREEEADELMEEHWIGELVRCEDCKYYDPQHCADGFGWCNRSGIGHGTSDDWFCADGERREDDA